jgi:hypothetical protein
MPAAAITHFRFREVPDADLFARVEREVVPEARIIEGISGLHVVQVAPDHFILVVLGDDAEVLGKFTTEVELAWMLEHVVPLLASPPERHLGPLVATTD